MKFEILVKIKGEFSSEICTIGAYCYNRASEKYFRKGIARSHTYKRIIFSEILKEFKNDDIVKMTFEKVEAEK